MNIFCLSTGRCGSTTFTASFSHATNYTSGHESRSKVIGPEHFDYPDQHIESDNRLSWLLGTLEKRYGDRAIYVHLFRNKQEVVDSYVKRYSPELINGIMFGFGHGILTRPRLFTEDKLPALADMYVDTVTDNIEKFLSNKSKVIKMNMHDPISAFEKVWEMGEVQGDFEAARSEWTVKHNRS